MKLSDRALFLVENLDLPAATGVDDARWEQFQLAHLNDDSTFRIENKSRQIAWSWTVAAEGVAEALLYGQSSAYVSINLVEAKEKIRYARLVYETLPRLTRMPRLTRDNELGLEFDNGARLLSLPATPPRGKSRMNVYLDEFAHVQHDRQIYTAAMPIISKGGRLRVGSSPLGASGVFWEIYAEGLRTYPGYGRKHTPWWEVQAFCEDVAVALQEAPKMLTAQRVARFGRPRIQAMYDNMPQDDFRQEYECEFVDETSAWITWDEIRAVQDPRLRCWMVSGKDAGLDAIAEMARGVPLGHVELVFAGGVDVGRTRNTTEIYLVGLSPTNTYPLRLAISLDNTDFDDQLTVLAHLLRSLPIVALQIDQNGIGRNLAESVARVAPGKAQGVDFTNATKALWATDVKMLIQQHKTPIPPDRDLAYQIHSIKRKVTPSKNLVFDTDANEKHHADRFWAWALALNAAYALGSGPGWSVGAY